MRTVFDLLIVEDESRIANDLVDRLNLLTDEFRLVGICRNGREALEWVRTEPPQIVFTDIVMPELNGIDLIRDIRALSRDILIVIISGFDEFEYARSALKYSVKDYLLKPIDDKKLRETVDNSLLELRQLYSSRQERNYSSLIHYAVPAPESVAEDTKELILFLVVAGNLLSPIVLDRSDGNRARIRHFRDRIAGDGRIFAVPDRSPNRVFVVSQRGSAPACVIRDEARSLVQTFGDDSNITCVYHGALISECELHEHARLLIQHAEMKKLPWRSSIEDTLPATFPFQTDESVFSEARNQSTILRELLTHHGTNEACREFIRFVREQIGRRITQRQLERTIQQILQELIYGILGSDTDTRVLTPDLKVLEVVQKSDSIQEFLLMLSDQFDLIFDSFIRLAPDEIAGAVARFLEEHYAEPITLTSICDHMGFESSYIAKVFRREHDTTPMKYLRAVRMERAKALLRERPHLDVGSIGTAVGYNDQHHFSRVFRNTTGVSPTGYREAAVRAAGEAG